jgi:hypothetical protein
MGDPYFEMIQEQWPSILAWYELLEEKRPIMLYDIQEQRIYAYPYREFKAEMSQKSQALLEEQYEKALVTNCIVVFVRDNEQEKLVSYSCPL